MSSTRCGYIALVGQPNVGKSTLMNHILGQKISITSRKPQTTRQQILGVKTTSDTQAIYVDTPGLHQQSKNALNRYMNRAAAGTLNAVDVIVFMVIADRWNEQDDWILEKLKTCQCPIVLVINKIDKLDNKKATLPLIKQYGEKFNFTAVIPLCAKNQNDIIHFEQTVNALLPTAERAFPEDQITDKSMRFIAAEIVREKIMRQTSAELPYSVALEVEEYKEQDNIIHIGIVIIVDRKNHKAMLIGKQGHKLREIGKQARLELEKMLETKVFLRLWVKVREGWADDERALNSLGYQDT